MKERGAWEEDNKKFIIKEVSQKTWGFTLCLQKGHIKRIIFVLVEGDLVSIKSVNIEVRNMWDQVLHINNEKNSNNNYLHFS